MIHAMWDCEKEREDGVEMIVCRQSGPKPNKVVLQSNWIKVYSEKGMIELEKRPDVVADTERKRETEEMERAEKERFRQAGMLERETTTGR